MKQVILIACIALFLFNGCKSRKISITHVDSSSVSHSVKIADSTVIKKDTSSHKVSQVILSSDSGSTITIYTPDSGRFITVEKDSITGIGKIVKTHHYVKKKQQNTNTIDQAKSNDSTAFKKSEVKSDSTHVTKKIKDVIATPSYGWIIYAVIGVLILIVGAWLIFKFLIKKAI